MVLPSAVVLLGQASVALVKGGSAVCSRVVVASVYAGAAAAGVSVAVASTVVVVVYVANANCIVVSNAIVAETEVAFWRDTAGGVGVGGCVAFVIAVEGDGIILGSGASVVTFSEAAVAFVGSGTVAFVAAFSVFVALVALFSLVVAVEIAVAGVDSGAGAGSFVVTTDCSPVYTGVSGRGVYSAVSVVVAVVVVLAVGVGVEGVDVAVVVQDFVYAASFPVVTV